MAAEKELMEKAVQLGGLSTTEAVIDAALRTFVRIKSQARIRSLRVQMRREGDLDELRTSRL